MQLGTWTKKRQQRWEVNIEKLNDYDYEELGMEEEELRELLSKLYDMRVID